MGVKRKSEIFTIFVILLFFLLSILFLFFLSFKIVLSITFTVTTSRNCDSASNGLVELKIDDLL